MENTLRLKLLDQEENMGTRDWRKALRGPPGYRIINRTIRGQTFFIIMVASLGIIILFTFYLYHPKGSSLRSSGYNFTYPLSSPFISDNMHTFKIGIIADLDLESKSKSEKNTWVSYFKKGFLSYSPTRNSVVVTWDRTPPVVLKSNFALKGRGLELSELVVFNGKLLTFDDRTGLVMEIANDKVYPWVLLMDGDGRSAKGFKSEWATVKNELLYVGSMGKEWTTASGDFENNNPQYVKIINTKGQVVHVNWVEEYKRIREVIGIRWPGYMIHESGVWSKVHKKWFFLPRRCSNLQYNETLDEHRGCSVLISADAELYDVSFTKIPSSKPTRGFSSFKFIPTSNDNVIVALRTEEVDGKTASYITAFTIKGEVLLDDLHIANLKYEGFEFI